MKAIIFGIDGQCGHYLADLLRKNRHDVVGVHRPDKHTNTHIANFAHVSDLIKTHQPDLVFHFAANSTTRHAVWQENHETISTGTLNILEAVLQFSPRTKVFLSGSGLQFRNQERPIKETDPFEASSSYCVSRIHTAYAARYYRSLGVRAYMGYFFNHDSPLRTERHVNQKIVSTARRIAAGSGERLVIGDPSVRKEFGFTGDHAGAVWALVNQEQIFEAVIGTGEAFTIEAWLQYCFSLCSLKWEDYVDIDPGYSSEYRVLVSDPSTIFSLGWRPTVSMKQLAAIMMG